MYTCQSIGNVILHKVMSWGNVTLYCRAQQCKGSWFIIFNLWSSGNWNSAVF
ncbi:hypothetical protein ACRRTK_014836 [Alexandromys fortis]